MKDLSPFAEIPVMTLPGIVLFPKTVLPLHIFEPRYREMLADILETNRVFAVAAIDPTHALESGGDEPPCRVATAGLIRACQKNDDGTSDLLLEGLVRIDILGIVREEPYRVVRVQPLPDLTGAAPADLERLRRELLRAFAVRSKLGVRLPADLDRAIRGIEDAAGLCDLLVFSIIGDPAFKQRMLETRDTAERLERVIARCRRDNENIKLRRRLQGSLDEPDIPNN